MTKKEQIEAKSEESCWLISPSIWWLSVTLEGLPSMAVVKYLPVSAGFDPWDGKIPREGNGKPLQCSCLGKPMDRGACTLQFSSVQSLSHVRLFATPWIAAHQASLSVTNSQSSPKPMSIELVMPCNHLILCHPLLLLPSIFCSIRVFSNESALRIRWWKYWSFSFNISPCVIPTASHSPAFFCFNGFSKPLLLGLPPWLSFKTKTGI